MFVTIPTQQFQGVVIIAVSSRLGPVIGNLFDIRTDLILIRQWPLFMISIILISVITIRCCVATTTAVILALMVPMTLVITVVVIVVTVVIIVPVIIIASNVEIVVVIVEIVPAFVVILDTLVHESLIMLCLWGQDVWGQGG